MHSIDVPARAIRHAGLIIGAPLSSYFRRRGLEGGSIRSHWIRFIHEYRMKCEWEENFQQRRISKINPLMSREELEV